MTRIELLFIKNKCTTAKRWNQEEYTKAQQTHNDHVIHGLIEAKRRSNSSNQDSPDCRVAKLRSGESMNT